MADYWKSQPKKFCNYCKCWIADNKPSIEFHERGKNHKENVIKKISEIKQKSMAKAKEEAKMSKEFAAMEEAALKAYEEDLKRLEGTQPAPVAPVGPTIEERRARDEQKRKEIQALEEHHAKKQWTKSFSPEGYPYYYNLLTGESKWEEPEEFQDNTDKSEEPAGKSLWVEGVSEEGYTYYYNSETGESRWEKPEDFVSSLPPSDDKKESPDSESESDKEDAEKELPAEAESDESESESATTVPKASKRPKIHFRSKKDEKEENDEEKSDTKEDTEKKQDTEKKDPSPVPSKPRQRTTTPYSAWEEIKPEKDPYENVDLELPNVEYDDPPVPSANLPEEPKVKFKEKTITSLGDAVQGVSVFKKRKLENVKSRNIRQRLNDY
ncbi:WW domain-binding protein 4 [Hyperolius riggenbachi]|uniref:WW domain-binding protein 4 n=1 Tax=Hyperolius riggenbachi TaxID=752182 RepID=UPI0035A34754